VPLWGEGKGRAVLALADEHGLDLERSFACSNGVKDVPFLETVGNPVAVSPERGLRAGAAARRVADASVRGTPGDAGAARARAHGGVLPRDVRGQWESGWVSASCVTRDASESTSAARSARI
jgi:hypothetical protein